MIEKWDKRIRILKFVFFTITGILIWGECHGRLSDILFSGFSTGFFIYMIFVGIISFHFGMFLYTFLHNYYFPIKEIVKEEVEND